MKLAKWFFISAILTFILGWQSCKNDTSMVEVRTETKVIQKITEPTKYGYEYVLLLEDVSNKRLFDLKVSLATFYRSEVGNTMYFHLNKNDLGMRDKMDDVYSMLGILLISISVILIAWGIAAIAEQ